MPLKLPLWIYIMDLDMQVIYQGYSLSLYLLSILDSVNLIKSRDEEDWSTGKGAVHMYLPARQIGKTLNPLYMNDDQMNS